MAIEDRNNLDVSVPIRGLFNLTKHLLEKHKGIKSLGISVPIRGLFNLTNGGVEYKVATKKDVFPSPLGDYLI